MVVNANTITLTGTGIDLDALLPDMDWYNLMYHTFSDHPNTRSL